MLSDRCSSMAGLDEDAAHWVSVSVRESVINAIKHGNKEAPDKKVTVALAA
ncbi:MAG: ATP-binding protein [Ilumatobacteraceae bacterium]